MGVDGDLVRRQLNFVPLAGLNLKRLDSELGIEGERSERLLKLCQHSVHVAI